MTGKIILIIIISYLIGNIQTSYILGKLIAKKDIRDYGSSNAGTTNALRVFGKKIAAATLIIDLLKGVLAVYIGGKILAETGEVIAGLFVIIGHIWPVFMGFKGGKGVATSIGVGLSLTPVTALISIVIGVAILIKTKYVSLGALTAIALWPIMNLIAYLKDGRILLIAVSFVLAAIVIFKHRANIERLMNGTENKVTKKVGTD